MTIGSPPAGAGTRGLGPGAWGACLLAFFLKIECYYKSYNGTILQFLARSSGGRAAAKWAQRRVPNAGSGASRAIDAHDQLVDDGTAPKR
jgi:hypothetical protein